MSLGAQSIKLVGVEGEGGREGGAGEGEEGRDCGSETLGSLMWLYPPSS